jgi:hypothetical protein
MQMVVSSTRARSGARRRSLALVMIARQLRLVSAELTRNPGRADYQGHEQVAPQPDESDETDLAAGPLRAEFRRLALNVLLTARCKLRRAAATLRRSRPVRLWKRHHAYGQRVDRCNDTRVDVASLCRDVRTEREELMDHTCLVVPVLPGKEGELRAFYREVDGPRQQDYDRSEQRLGITKEIAWVAPVDGGSAAVIYIESENFEQAFSEFVQSQDEFDLWFKQHVLDISGLDLNNPPEMELPEVLSVYQAKLAVAT